MSRRPVCQSCFSRVSAVDSDAVCRSCRREAESLVADLADRTRPPDAAEVEARRLLVRAAKGPPPGRSLAPAELDAILPPVDCARTRARLEVAS